jgi:hypothetical protein
MPKNTIGKRHDGPIKKSFAKRAAPRPSRMHPTHLHVQKHGVSIQCVLGDDEHPPMAYTIGLQVSHQHPDLIIMGLDKDTSMAFLNDIVETLIAAGKPLVDKQVITVAELNQTNTDLRIHQVTTALPEARVEMTQAGVYYDEYYPELNIADSFPVMQVLFPSVKGLWPDEFVWKNQPFLA